MIARVAQHSFSKIQNCLENTVSKNVCKCCKSDRPGRATPRTPSPPSLASSQVTSPAASTLPQCRHPHRPYFPVSLLRGRVSRGECESGGPCSDCKRFTWAGPLRQPWELIWAWSFSGTGWELCTRTCTGSGSAPASFSAASACPAPVGCRAPRLRDAAVRGMHSPRERRGPGAWGS